jgi:hypothetical protein
MVYLIIGFIVAVVLAKIASISLRVEKIISISLIITLLSFELFYFYSKVFLEDIEFLIALPVYWCAVTNFLIIIALIKRDSFLIRVSAFMMMGPIFAMVVESSQIDYTLRYYISHTGIIVAILYAIFAIYKEPKELFFWKILTFVYVMIYFIVFEMLYPFLLKSLFGNVSTFVDYLYIFNDFLMNITFVVCVGSIYVFFISYFIIDYLIAVLRKGFKVIT